MGLRGKMKTPSNIVVMTGNPAKRPIREDPIPPNEVPIPPSFLDEYAIEEWNRVWEGLYAMKILYAVDSHILAAYCDSVSLWRKCNEQLKKQAIENPSKALVETTYNGSIIQNTLVGMTNVAKRDVIKYASLLGIGARARAELGKVPDKGKSKFAGLIKTQGITK